MRSVLVVLFRDISGYRRVLLRFTGFFDWVSLFACFSTVTTCVVDFNEPWGGILSPESVAAFTAMISSVFGEDDRLTRLDNFLHPEI